MQAQVGDWLLVNSASEHGHARRGLILSVRAGGVPPYGVRWVDQEHEVLFFPGPDAEAISPARLAELDHAEQRRVANVQASIAARKS